ncbi:MAG: ABC transporter ATP-binding protein [Chloroflexota bacterium]
MSETTPRRGATDRGDATTRTGATGRTAATGRIELRDIAVSFPAGARERLTALDGVDLTVEPGEIVALIGPNGSGKSTLLRVVAGLLRPDRGSARIDGGVIDGPDPRVGLVFQEPRLLAWRTTASNIAYPLELAGVDPETCRARVAALLETVGLERAANQVPSQLSGGMRQRAALARTLALEPEVLLLDEPFSALDELTRERLNLELLAITARTPTTILLVTHSVQEAIFLADRVVVLSARPGRVVADIPVRLSRPRSLQDLDAAVVTETAQSVRSYLGEAAA